METVLREGILQKQQQDFKNLCRNRNRFETSSQLTKTILNSRMKTLAQQENPRLALDTMDLKKNPAFKPSNDYVSLQINDQY